jgi:putative membrane protein
LLFASVGHLGCAQAQRKATMSSSDEGGQGGRFTVRTTSDSHFSWIRTRMSVERTLMSWVRTGVSLIGFGFTIVQFFERLHDMEGVAAATRPGAPRILGLSLIAAGVISVAIAAYQYVRVNKYLSGTQFAAIASLEQDHYARPALWVAILVAFIGAFAFGAVYFRFM